jgi:hypothetical protein
MTFPADRYEEFLRSAALGSIRLGVDELSVLKTAGPAEDEGVLGSAMRILSFQSKHLQVTFKHGRVVHWGLYFREERCVPVSLRGIELSCKTSVSDLCHWMRGKGIEWDADRSSEGVRIKFRNGVVAVFDGGMLDSLQVT